MATAFLRCTKRSSGTRVFRKEWSRLQEVPRGIPADSECVYLQSNRITSILAGIFGHLSQCKRLDLRSNRISSIEEQAFEGMGSLQLLMLSSNRLTALKSGMFAGLRNLKWLIVGSNQISSIGEGTFSSLHSLKYLRLSCNRLKTLSPDVFRNLPRPLRLNLNCYPRNSNQWNCNSLCWLKHEEERGTIKWTQWHVDGKLFPSYPTCADGRDWNSIQCGDPGE